MKESTGQIEPGDTLTFWHGNERSTGWRGKERLTGRAWPAWPRRLIVETLRGAVELSSIDPERDDLEVRKARPRRKGQKPHPSVQSFNDFRPGLDLVIRWGSRHFVLSTDGSYAAFEVEEAPIAVFRAGFARMKLGPFTAAEMFSAVRTTPFLSEEGRAERLAAFLEAGLVSLRFEVAAPRGGSS